jgi:hypothetical protein
MTGRRIVVAGREPLARAGRGRTLRTGALGQALLVALPVIAIVVVWWAVTATLDRARVFPPPDLVGAELMASRTRDPRFDLRTHQGDGLSAGRAFGIR